MSHPIPDQRPLTPEPPPPPPPPPEVAPELPAPKPVKLRPVAIALFVAGLIMVGLGFAEILPGGVLTGAVFAGWGVLLFAFSFIPLPKPGGKDEPPMSTVEKLTGIFFEPTRVFRNLRSHPYWLAPFLVISILTAVYEAAFFQRLTPERIVTYTMDKLEQAPIKPPAEQMEAVKESNLQQAKQPIQRVQTAAKKFVGVFALYCFVSAVCLLGVIVFGGRMNFWQTLAAVFYAAMPVAVLHKVLSLVILFIKDPDDVHPILNQESLVQDNLGFFFSPAENPVLFVLGSGIGILSFYSLWLRARGLANAGYKVSPSAAWGTTILIFILAMIFGAVLAALFPSFFS